MVACLVLESLKKGVFYLEEDIRYMSFWDSYESCQQ